MAAGKLKDTLAFEFYVSLGRARSYSAVAREFSVSKRAIVELAKREGWGRRVELIDRRAQESLEKRTIETLEQMNERHLKSLRAIQGKALQALRDLPLKSAMEAVRALDLAIKGERVVRGEPSDRTELSLEETVRREYDRWLTPAESDDSGTEDR